MKNNVDLLAILKTIADGFRRYNLTIFIVVFVGGLAVAVIMLNTTIQKSSDTTGYTSTPQSTTFNQATIDRIKELHTSSEPVTSTLPSGRINPFNE